MIFTVAYIHYIELKKQNQNKKTMKLTKMRRSKKYFHFCETDKGSNCYYSIQQFKNTFKPLLEITKEKYGKNNDTILLGGYFNDKISILMENLQTVLISQEKRNSLN